MMPIGVPRVPYRTPKEGGWQWVDIWNCLYRERIIFLSKPVDEELGNQVTAALKRQLHHTAATLQQSRGDRAATPNFASCLAALSIFSSEMSCM